MSTSTINIPVTRIKESRIDQLFQGNIKFGHLLSDHVFEVDYADEAWHEPRISPYQDLVLSPANSALHYGQAIFEGMKAFKGANNETLLFRPLENVRRLNQSALRMCMPEINEELFMAGLKKLLEVDNAWIPGEEGSSLYIRPFMIAMDNYLGVRPSSTYKFMIITSPAIGAYYDAPVKVRIETQFSRACPGGTGNAKAAGNYAASLYPAKMAQVQGFDQLIWTDAKEHKYIEESGTMNLMAMIDGKLITSDLNSGTILPGITRDSVLTLARDWGVTVEERPLSVQEIIDAHGKGLLTEMFGTGTAVTIGQIAAFSYDDELYQLPPVERREFSNKVKAALTDIKKGRAEDPYGWMVRL